MKSIKYLFVLKLLILFTFSTLIAQPTITQHPVNQSVLEGSIVTFSVQATGSGTLTYQWYKNGSSILGANLHSYTTPATTLADSGSIFHCDVDDSNGTTSSNNAILTVIAGDEPVITLHPKNQYIVVGQTATFSIAATGTAPLQYQWKKNNVNISGAINSSYTTPTADLVEDGAIYTCEVSNNFGSVVSNFAQLTVVGVRTRFSDNLQVLYRFDAGHGKTIEDISEVGDPLNFNIGDTNNASWTDLGLTIHGDAQIKTQVATKLIDACKTSNELTFEAWMLPSNMVQRNSYNRIITLSKDNNHEQNFAALQYKDQYWSVIRSSSTDLNGNEYLLDSNEYSLLHFVFTRSSDGIVKIYKDGNLMKSYTLSGDFSNWNNDYRLILGNDATNTSFWEGTFYLVAAYNRALTSNEVKHNFSVTIPVDMIPSFIEQPEDQYVMENGLASFSVTAISKYAISYQWKRNGVDIVGANSADLVYQATGNDDGAVITCVATTSEGSKTSYPAVLYVTKLDQRVSHGQKVLYTFKEGSGNTINDMSNEGTPLNLSIETGSTVSWTNHGLVIKQPTNITSAVPGNKIIDAVKGSNEITVEAWVKPINLLQDGPATIFNISADANTRNFSLSQIDDRYNVRVRTIYTGLDGSAIESDQNSVDSSEFNHVVYTKDNNGEVRLYINGTERVSESKVGAFTNWGNYFLSIGNEIGGGHPWLGTINLISVFDRALSQAEVLNNFAFGAYGVILNPSDLVLVSNEVDAISMSWTDNSDNETGFIVDRGEGEPIVYKALDTLLADETTFTDDTIEEKTNYIYRVIAINSVGMSGYSNEVEVTSLIKPIASPNNLSYSYNAEGYPVISWNDNSNNELGFKIERRIIKAGSSFSVIDSVDADVTSFEDLTVNDSTSYVYRIYGYNLLTVSEFSDEKIVDIGTIVGVDVTNNIPTEFSLSQNYPNPFNPTTKIKFSLPEKSQVSISVFNMLGQKVGVILDGDFSAGYFEHNFNALNYPSGIYIYSLTAKSVNGKTFTNTKKMILIK